MPGTLRSACTTVADTSAPSTHGLTSSPPVTVPSSTAPTIETSIQPLAATSRWGRTVSVIKPYLAGAYAAAARPTTAKHSSGCAPHSSSATPANLSAFIQAIKRALGTASASGPTHGASSTYDKVKVNFSSGAHQPGRPSSCSRAMATISSALSASADVNCAAMIR